MVLPDLQAEPEGFELLEVAELDTIAAQYTTFREHGATNELKQDLAAVVDATKH